ncbi:MAG: glycoside hydrolase family 13 protein [Clostridia bacterium]
MTIYHNSRLKELRSPLGAVTSGSPITLAVRASVDSTVTLRLFALGKESFLDGVRDGEKTVFSFFAPETPCCVFYRFIVNDGERIYSYSARTGEGSEVSDPYDSDYQITVYDEALKTPDWFKSAIVYQIFPDRFKRKGELGGLINIDRHTNLGRRVYIHKNWDDEPTYLPFPNGEFYEPRDFFGGDLYGVLSEVDYIKSLSADCVYLNPIFESASNHRYDVGDYEHVDPVLGGDEALTALVSAFKEEKLHIVLDGVFSHTGADSVYFNKYGRYKSVGAYNSPDSPYAKWYDFLEFPDKYRSWWGFTSLPEVNELDDGYFAFICSVISKYAKLGISSWRLDVADELPDEFIRMLRAELKRNDEDALLIGEVWENASRKFSMGHMRGYVNGDELDSVTNYPFRTALFNFLLEKTDAFALENEMFLLQETYPREFYMSLLNVLGSHDTVRALTALSGAPDRDALTREASALYSPNKEDLARGKKRMFLASMVQFFMPGVPCVYYGDEVGALGMADPFNRAPYPWGREDNALLSHYRALGAVRRENKTLLSGKTSFCAVNHDVFAIMRLGTGDMMLVINRSAEEKKVNFPQSAFLEGVDGEKMHISGTWRTVYEHPLNASRFFENEFYISAYSGVILKKVGAEK